MKDYNELAKRCAANEDGGNLYWGHAFGANVKYCIAGVKAPDFDINGLLAFLDEWEAAHPQKTYAQDFFEKHPNAAYSVIDRANVPDICLFTVDFNKPCPFFNFPQNDCYLKNITQHAACWNRPMPDNR